MQINWEKRIKSFFITLCSILAPALIAVLTSPAFGEAGAYVSTTLVAWGAPALVVTFIGVAISEAVKQWINDRKVMQAESQAKLSAAGGAAGAYKFPLDLY